MFAVCDCPISEESLTIVHFLCHLTAQFDTTWGVQATLEKKLLESQFPMSLNLSAEGNPVKSDFKFGVGLQIG